MLPLSSRKPCFQARLALYAEHGSAMKSGSMAAALQGSAAPNGHGSAVATLLINRPDSVRAYSRGRYPFARYVGRVCDPASACNRPDSVRAYSRGRNEPSILHMAHIDGDRHELR